MKLPSVTVSRRWLSKLFEVLSPAETFLAGIALSAFLFSWQCRAWWGSGFIAALYVGIAAAALGMVLVFFQALALAACDLLRRIEFRQLAQREQKVAEAREKKGHRSYQPEGRKLSLRDRARMGDPSAQRRLGQA